ncbi:response regulator transcription factor [Streptomyces sp. MP131-18]|uniref:response regulator transcription factor n=1 Tax=Streptomyces sp. MP131-18 TaxID=1857892 RepID=UPI0009D444B4|nr:response regulator transcription factor [Streptomyces sp. MP131-18]ONK09314.1 Sensory transduction protein regX3 [Streptomyces sp. MP131-18]
MRHQTQHDSTQFMVAGPLQDAHSWQILVVESDERAARSLCRRLEEHGHRVRCVRTGMEALRARQGADVILMDFELPDVDGLDMCRSLTATSQVPLLAVTGRSDEADRVLGLRAGADDYLVKPYGFQELLARMEAVMRRSSPTRREQRVVRMGPLSVNPAVRTAVLSGQPLRLTRKEFDLLHVLMARPGAVVSREQLMQCVWQESDTVHSRTLDTHVSGLRRKLGSTGWIVTVRGVGFRLAQP